MVKGTAGFACKTELFVSERGWLREKQLARVLGLRWEPIALIRKEGWELFGECAS